MVFCKEENRELLQSLKNIVQRDRETGEYIPPNFDSILQSLDEMSAKNDGRPFKGPIVDSSAIYSPGRKEYEVLRAYNSLIDAGGRPICPLGDINHISKDPESYLDILIPWIGESRSGEDLDWRGIFQQQLSNWQRFRAWQQAPREIPADTIAVASSKNSLVAGDIPSLDNHGGIRNSKFEIHVKSTRDRLADCGFTKMFHFNIDTDRQDDWTTWVEYLSFECHCFDECSRSLEQEEVSRLHKAMFSDYSIAQTDYSPWPARPDQSWITSDDSTTQNKHNHIDVSSLPSDSGHEQSPCNSKWRKSYVNVSPAATAAIDSEQLENTLHDDSSCNIILARGVKLTDAEHHTLILRWAFLQEPEIAAMCIRKQLVGSVHRKAMLTPSFRRLKRHRDGSICSRAATLGNTIGAYISSDENDKSQTKRCRGSGQQNADLAEGIATTT